MTHDDADALTVLYLRRNQLMTELHALDAQIATTIRENVAATAAATTVAGYATMRRDLDQLIGVADEVTAGIYARINVLSEAIAGLRDDLRALRDAT